MAVHFHLISFQNRLVAKVISVSSGFDFFKGTIIMFSWTNLSVHFDLFYNNNFISSLQPVDLNLFKMLIYLFLTYQCYIIHIFILLFLWFSLFLISTFSVIWSPLPKKFIMCSIHIWWATVGKMNCTLPKTFPSLKVKFWER